MDLEQLKRLPPDQLAKMMRLGTNPKRDDLLDQQMQQQIAAGQPSGEEHSTGVGAALGGLGDVIKGTASAAHVQALRGDRSKLLDEQDALNGGLFGPGEAPLSPPPMVQAEGGSIDSDDWSRAPAPVPWAGMSPSLHGDGQIPSQDLSGAAATPATVAALRGQSAPTAPQGVPQQGPTSAEGGELAKLLRGAKTAHPYTF